MAVLLALPTRRRAAFAYAGINAKGFATSMYQGTSAEWSDFHVLLRIGRNPIFLFSQRRWFGFHPTTVWGLSSELQTWQHGLQSKFSRRDSLRIRV
jgi:hypothetical protein